MPDVSSLRIEVDPSVTSDQLFDFYSRNNICEAEYGKETASRILAHPHVIVAAIQRDTIVGLARATFDGSAAHIMELSLALDRQGPTRHNNGSLIEADPSGLGAEVSRRLLAELRSRGCDFVSCYIVAGCEEPFYSSIGFRENEGHLAYCVDERPYVSRAG